MTSQFPAVLDDRSGAKPEAAEVRHERPLSAVSGNSADLLWIA
jgi:hypothetical protein